ncbi:MAG TPA: hypothetical protein VEX70_12615 [Pyrinomonadaceae bacterium]|nr:hypothetical protein [Pyrinomonadaceae bacterium]
MKTDDYRRDYAAYSAALERARYDYRAGVEPELRLAPLRDRYADLWTRAAVDDLTRALEETSLQFDTERTALSALLRAAQLGYAEAQAAEVTGELTRCCASVSFEWNGLTFAAHEGRDALAAEPDAARGRELAARWFDSLLACDDLRAARLDALRAAARSLGFDSYFNLLSGLDGETGVESLSAGAAAFLEHTARAYHTNLSAWAVRHLPAEFARSPAYPDALRLAQLTHLEGYFHEGYLRSTYEATMRDLRIRPAQQTNLRVEATSGESRRAPARCFPVSPPDDVRLVYDETRGASSYQTLFEAAGRAQHFAWLSRDLSARYPEFVHAHDEATRAGFAFLFGDLLADRTWLAAHRQVRPSEADEIARSFALFELHRTRRACVVLQHERALEDAPDARAEQLGASYATALEEATGFSAHPALHLHDLIPFGLHAAQTVDAPLPPAVHLRARLFATALGEYLRTRYGHRWWSTNKVADELIDMWNTGSRYTVEELASLAGLGSLSFDLLADSINSTLTRE